LSPITPLPSRPRRRAANALSGLETVELLAVLRSARFWDLAPAQIWAVLIDEGSYLGVYQERIGIDRKLHALTDELREVAETATNLIFEAEAKV
jgi:putative transposase